MLKLGSTVCVYGIAMSLLFVAYLIQNSQVRSGKQRERSVLPKFHVIEGGEFISADDAFSASFEQSHHDFLGALPIVFRNVTTGWRASSKWTPKWIVNNIKFLKDVVELKGSSNFWYEESSKVVNLDDSSKKSKRQLLIRQMATSDFFGPECDKDRMLWHSSSLEVETSKGNANLTLHAGGGTKQVHDDIEPIGKFMVNDLDCRVRLNGNDVKGAAACSSTADDAGEYRIGLSSANAWFGCGVHITTRLHYDMSHNVFHQIYGRKRFTLVPACSQPQHPFTSRRYLHPSNKSTEDDMLSAARGREFDGSCYNGEVAVVTLNPNDLLYLPPIMYHNVESLDPRSISVNIWSRSRLEGLLDEVLYSIALPFNINDARWDNNLAFRATVALQYLEQVVSGNSKHYVKAPGALMKWYASRWAPYSQPSPKLKNVMRKLKKTLPREPLSNARLQKYAERAERVRSVLSGISKRYRRILLWNYCDSVITFTVGNDEEIADVVGSFFG